jgi:DNA polymerase III delta prime subunit
MKLETHNLIKKKLDYFISMNRIPHIIFHGPSGSGKREILNWFIDKIYSKDKEFIKTYVMYVNCAHIKGIRFIRDELKFFAKINIQNNEGILFKSIILFNADKLTVDAQSALRRCIEKFSHTTRFFIVIENKDKLLKPILSRFCNFYIPYPVINDKITNLHIYNKNKNDNEKKMKYLKNNINKHTNNMRKLISFTYKLYHKGYSALDIIQFIEDSKNIDEEKKYFYLIYFDKIRREFRNEILLMNIFLYFIFMRNNQTLEI